MKKNGGINKLKSNPRGVLSFFFLANLSQLSLDITAENM